MSNRNRLASTVYECLRAPVPMGIDAFRRGAWTAGPRMVTSHAHHTATRIGDDVVLVAGGRSTDGMPTARTELFDAYDQGWTEMPPMATPRSHHVAVSLPSGKVLVLGGTRLRGAQGATTDVEIFDPVVRRWFRAAPMSRARARHAAAVLRDGTVLVAGGCGEAGRIPDAEIYDPTLDAWREVAPMRSARSDHSLTSTENGRVLAAGRSASGGDGCESYDVAQDRWLRRPSPIQTPTAHTATLLPDGRVLVIGGVDPRGASMASADVYYPKWATWSEVDAPPACDAHTAVPLRDGGVVLLGGAKRFGDETPPEALEHCAIFDPAAGTWSRGPTMPRRRFGHTATLIPNAGIVVCGGHSAFDVREPLDTSDVFAPSWEGFSRIR